MRFYITVLFVCLLGLAGCDTHPGRAVQGQFADSVHVDSLTLWAAREGEGKHTDTVYVLDSVAAIYTMDGEQLHFDTVVSIGEVVEVTTDGMQHFFGQQFYPVSYDGHVGYMRGTSLGYGLHTDFDNDGKEDLVLYGYEHYTKDSIDDMPVNPLVIRFVSATGSITTLRDTVASDLDMTEVQHVRLSDHVHVYEVNAGYPACGYPQFHLILAYGNGKLEKIHRSVTSTDSGMGDYCQFYYPSDSTHRIDTIFIARRLSLPISDAEDAPLAEHTTDSTILYLHKGAWGTRNYKLDSTSN